VGGLSLIPSDIYHGRWAIAGNDDDNVQLPRLVPRCLQRLDGRQLQLVAQPVIDVDVVVVPQCFTHTQCSVVLDVPRLSRLGRSAAGLSVARK